MRYEQALRLPDFREGVAACLADGQDWILAGPPQDDEEAADFGRDYEALVSAVLEASDLAERRLAELCLAIFLLGKNYDLSSADYEALLELPSGDQALVAMQEAFHEIAAAHVQNLQIRRQSQVDPSVHSQPLALSRCELRPSE